MQQPPYMPPPPVPPKRAPRWAVIGLAVVITTIVVSVVLLNIPVKSVNAPVVVTVTPPPSPSPSPSPAITDPVIVDPMDEAMAKLKADVYVGKYCSMMDRVGISLFASVMEGTAVFKPNSMGAAWNGAKNATGASFNKLAHEFYDRYC